LGINQTVLEKIQYIAKQDFQKAQKIIIKYKR